MNINYESRLKRDHSAITIDEDQSQQPGDYKLKTHYQECRTPKQHVNSVTEVKHFIKQYPNNICHANVESDLWQSELTNKRYINQLYHRPYVGSYMGAGANNSEFKNIESKLLQKNLTNPRMKSCEEHRTASVHEHTWDFLPEYGNPQRVEHIIHPIPRGGYITRNDVHRYDYDHNTCSKKPTQFAF
jgi:hypothetical protein